MMLGCDEASRQGMIVSNINTLILDNVKVTAVTVKKLSQKM